MKHCLIFTKVQTVRTHQLLSLRAEEGIDTNDEGRGGAQDLEEFSR